MARRRRAVSMARSYPSSNQNVIQKTFKTWGEFVSFAVTRTNESQDGAVNQSRQHDRDFTGTETFKEALELAQYGWPEGEELAKGIASPIFDKVSTLIEKQIYSYGNEGIDFDIARVIEGEPECWLQQSTVVVESSGHKHLRIVFNNGVSGGISSEVITAKGATVAALIQLLEYAGHRVELWVGQVHDGSANRLEMKTLVKESDQDLDMSRVIFALAHPSTPRRFGLAVVESDKAAIEEMGRGYGTPSDFKEQPDCDLYFGRALLGEPSWTNPDSAKAWVIEKLQEQGVKLREE
jgi:hypothetical protein